MTVSIKDGVYKFTPDTLEEEFKMNDFVDELENERFKEFEEMENEHQQTLIEVNEEIEKLDEDGKEALKELEE